MYDIQKRTDSQWKEEEMDDLHNNSKEATMENIDGTMRVIAIKTGEFAWIWLGIDPLRVALSDCVP